MADDTFVISVFNGLGKLFAWFGPDTNGTGGIYIEQLTLYDSMGRVARETNPTEVDSNWGPTADDHNGYVYTRQTYDWKGRPLNTIHEADGTVKYALYDGCGCAGGERVTIIDEVNRAQRTTADVFGRVMKTEVLTWPDNNGVRSVYATTVNNYNTLDQVTLVRQWAGAENGGGAYQDTTMSYDGYGRLQSKLCRNSKLILTCPAQLITPVGTTTLTTPLIG